MATPIMYEPVCLYGDYAPDAATSLYTAPAGQRVIVKEIWICNNTDALVQLKLNRVDEGDSADGSNRIFNNFVPAGASVSLAMSMVLAPGTSLNAEADTASAIALTISAQVEQL